MHQHETATAVSALHSMLSDLQQISANPSQGFPESVPREDSELLLQVSQAQLEASLAKATSGCPLVPPSTLALQ